MLPEHALEVFRAQEDSYPLLIVTLATKLALKMIRGKYASTQFILYNSSAQLNKPDNMANINDNKDGTKGFNTHKVVV